jgi:intracellular sulfur oxidation DsrE/DsrF family protein
MLGMIRGFALAGGLALAIASGTAGMVGDAANAQDKDRSTRSSGKTEKSAKTPKTHKIAIQISEEKPEHMNLALNNARNIVEHYKSLGENVQIEIVAYGPGLHMFRSDTSPVKQRVAQMSLESPNIVFAACANTHTRMQKSEEKPITLLSEAKIVPSGVVRLAELQRQGWSYIRP